MKLDKSTYRQMLSIRKKKKSRALHLDATYQYIVLVYNCVYSWRHNASKQNGRHLSDDIFKCFLLNEKLIIHISLKYAPKCPMYITPALVLMIYVSKHLDDLSKCHYKCHVKISNICSREKVLTIKSETYFFSSNKTIYIMRNRNPSDLVYVCFSPRITIDIYFHWSKHPP